MQTKYLKVVACAVLLTACSGSPDKEPLKGERIRVMVEEINLKPDPEVAKSALYLPPPGTSDGWAQSGGNAAHAPGHAALAAQVERVWDAFIGAGRTGDERYLNAPVSADGKVFMLSTDGEVTAISASDGKRLWEKELELSEESHLEFSGGIAAAGSSIFVTTGTGEVVALAQNTGEEIWRRNLQVPLRSAPTVHGKKVFVTGIDNRLFVLNEADGSLEWAHSGIEESLALLGGAPAAVKYGKVAVPYSSGEVYVLQSDDGRYIWHDALSMSARSDPFSTLVDVLAPPVIVDNEIYAVNHNGQLAVFSLDNGQRLWSRDMSATQMPWVAGNVIYVINEQNQLVALNRPDGRVRWVTKLKTDENDADAAFWSGPVLAGRRLIAVSSDGVAVSVDPFSGRIVKAAPLGEAVSVPPVVADGTLYFLTDDGRLIAFR